MSGRELRKLAVGEHCRGFQELPLACFRWLLR